MQNTIATIQSDAVSWLKEHAIQVYRPNQQDYFHALHKVSIVCFIFISVCDLLL